MDINCYKITDYSDNDPRYNFHIDDSSKYNKNIYPLHLIKDDMTNEISVYDTIDDTIKWDNTSFIPKNLQPNSFYDQMRIKNDTIEHFDCNIDDRVSSNYMTMSLYFLIFLFFLYHICFR